MTGPARFDFPWTFGLCAAALVATACALSSWGGAVGDLLVADRRLADGQIWRAFAGPLVHATWGHLVRDLAVVAIAGAAYERPLRRIWPALLALAAAVPTVVSLAAGGVSWYCGLSGLSHALIAAALAFEVGRRRGRARLYAAAVAAVVLVKVGYEIATGAPAFPMDLGEGVRQLPIAHAAGLAVGALAGAHAIRRCALEAEMSRT